MYIVIKSAGDDYSFTSIYVDSPVGHNYVYAQQLAEKMTKAMKSYVNKKWSNIYTLEGVTDFYADNDFEDALQEVCENIEDLSQRIKITVELVDY